jgi:deazaflavin-dependent oxidoreductase (nitroreductase family)
MAQRSNDLKDRLSRSSEITISVTGRKSGRTISNTIRFVYGDPKLYLLPVKGSDTQWYKNVLQNPSIQIAAGGARVEAKAVPLTDSKDVTSVIQRFRDKYTANDVKKYYSKFDVAVLAQM